MKRLLFAFSILLFLTACGGNKLDLDIERTLSAVAERSSNYDEEDIELVRACETVKIGEEEFGFDGEYIIFWQSKDGEEKREYTMENYEAGFGADRLEIIEDRCIDLN